LDIARLLTADISELIARPVADGAAARVPGRLSRSLAWADRHRQRGYAVFALLVVLASMVSIATRTATIGTGSLPSEGLRGNGRDFSATIDARPVSYKPMLTEGHDWLADAIGWSFYGAYDSWTGRISLNERLRAPGRAQGRTETLRHETGHMLFDDVARHAAGDGLAGSAYGWWVSTTGRLANRPAGWLFAWSYPEPLRAAYGSYLRNRGVYQPEFTNAEANLGEYFAESYSRLLSGEEMPEDMVPVLDRMVR